MEQADRPRRKYNSTRRTEQARETRMRILSAALDLFSSNGYSGATVEAIAQKAGVAPLTVFSIFGNKRSILAALVKVSVGGDDQPIPILERPEPRKAMAQPTQELQLRAFAADMTSILARVSPVFEIMRAAAKTEPEIDDLLRGVLSNRLRNLTIFAERLSDKGRLRSDIDVVRAGEIVWAVASPELYRLFTADRGWSNEEFANWLSDTLIRLLLP